ncbi:MAG: low molecular weight protein-tyrosine-phosphatase [Opitutales bacterium]
MPNPTRILFVCLGNICRSPAAEGVFAHLASQAGVRDQFAIDSAGTIGFHAGAPADGRMRAAARPRGYELRSVSRPVTEEDFETYDLLLAMDRSNFYELRERAPADARERIQLFSEAALGEQWDVPDPYYGGETGFEKVLDQLERGCAALLAKYRNAAS